MERTSGTTRFIGWLITWRWLLFAVAVALSLLALRPARQLAFDRAIENMFAPDDPLLPPYAKLKRTFGGNEIVMATYVDAKLFTPEGMARLAALETRLNEIAGVKDVLTIHSLMGEEILASNEADGNPIARRFRDLFAGYTHRENAETGIIAVAAVCMLAAENPETPRRATINALREAIEELPQGSLAGEPVMVVDGFRYLEEDGQRLGFTSTLLLIATIAICFRSVRWVLAPMLVVQAALLWTRAGLVLSGFRLSMVSSMLTAIVNVVGVATVIHIIVRYREARDADHPPRAALLAAGTLLVMPIFWACATDAVGFGSLLVAGVGPVQDFGLMMAAGSLLVLLAVVLVIPGVALALPGIDPDPRRPWGEGIVEGELARLLRFVEERPRSLLLAIVLISAAATAGSARLTVESDFTKNFRERSPVAQSYAFIESNLGGAGVWDVIVPAPSSLSWDYLKRVRKLERRLQTEVPELSKVLSLADAVVAGSPVDLDRAGPFARRVALSASLALMQRQMPEFYAALYGQDPETVVAASGSEGSASAGGLWYLRIMLRAPERQPAEAKQAMIDAVTRITREEFGELRKAMPAALAGHAPEAEPEVTGFFVLLTSLIDSIIRDQWVTFGVATAGIGLMMLLAFRSLSLAAVSLVPNVLPILVVMGCWGWLGLKINMGAAMIAAVSIGLSIDSSVHYIAGFQRAQRAGHRVSAALGIVQRDVGLAMFFSTVALIVGFGALCFSEFVPTIYFGALVSLTMLGGLAGPLLVLPLLLKLVARDEKREVRSESAVDS